MSCKKESPLQGITRFQQRYVIKGEQLGLDTAVDLML
jgi:hypothetical protein